MRYILFIIFIISNCCAFGSGRIGKFPDLQTVLGNAKSIINTYREPEKFAYYRQSQLKLLEEIYLENDKFLKAVFENNQCRDFLPLVVVTYKARSSAKYSNIMFNNDTIVVSDKTANGNVDMSIATVKSMDQRQKMDFNFLIQCYRYDLPFLKKFKGNLSSIAKDHTMALISVLSDNGKYHSFCIDNLSYSRFFPVHELRTFIEFIMINYEHMRMSYLQIGK